MAWSIESVLHAVVNAPDKALAKLDRASLAELPTLLADARRRRDADDGQRVALLACLTGSSAGLSPEDLAWALLARPRLPDARFDACLAALSPAQLLALEDALPVEEREALLRRAPPEGRRLLARRAPERWSFAALVFALQGDPAADEVLWAERHRRPPDVRFVFGLRPARTAWLDELDEGVAEDVGRTGWSGFDAAFGVDARPVLIERVVARVDGPDAWALEWLRERAPERAAQMERGVLGPEPDEPPLDTAWIALAFPGGPPRDRASFEAWIRGLPPVDLADLDGAFAMVDGDPFPLRLAGRAWGLGPIAAADPWEGPQDWSALAAAHAFGQAVAAEANAARVGPSSDGLVTWRRAVLRADEPIPEAVSALFGLPPGQVVARTFHARPPFGRDAAAGDPILALFRTRTRGPMGVELGREVVGVTPELVLGWIGPYLAGMLCVRVWT